MARQTEGKPSGKGIYHVEVVALDEHGPQQLLHVQVREQVENCLHVVNDLVVHGKLAVQDVLQVRAHFVELLLQSAE